MSMSMQQHSIIYDILMVKNGFAVPKQDTTIQIHVGGRLNEVIRRYCKCIPNELLCTSCLLKYIAKI